MKLDTTTAKNAINIVLPIVLGGGILYWMYRGFDFGKGFKQHFRRGNLAEVSGVRPGAERREKVERAAIGVGQRQECQCAVAALEELRPYAECDIARKGVA